MSVFKKLKEIGYHSKPYHGFAKLEIGYHQVVCFRSTETTYGKTIVVELDNEVLFLPRYFVEKLTDDDILELNSSIEKENIYLYFGGQREKNK